MNNFVSVFEELSKLYEADELEQEIAAEEPEVAEEAPAEEVAAEETPKQLVLECAKCGALVVKAEEEVVIDEATDLANVEDECATCEEAAGYKVLGELLPYATEEAVEESIEDPESKPEADLPAEGDQDGNTPDVNKQPEPEVTEALLESALTEGKLLDNVKKVATRVGADAATIVRCFTELGEMIANTGNKGEYKTTKLNDFMEYVENKAAFKALMNGNESVLNGTTKEDLEELAQDIEDYKKAKAGKKDDGEDLEELLDANVNLSLDGGEGNDVDVL